MKVYLGMPAYSTSNCSAAAVMAMGQCSDGSFSSNMEVTVSCLGNSVLPQVFNELLCEAINSGADFFALLHADVCPLKAGWLDTMMGIMETRRADILSVVIPYKNNYQGITSTAIDYGHDLPVRKLTLHEVHAGEKTFWKLPKDAYGEGELLVNTGCMLMRLNKTKTFGGIRDYPGKPFAFKFVNWNEISPKGKWVAGVLSEDYGMSRELRQRGARIYATVEIPVYHKERAFHNVGPWGSWQTDEAWHEYMKIEKEQK